MKKTIISRLLLIPVLLLMSSCDISLEHQLNDSITSDISKEDLIAAINNSYLIKDSCRSYSSNIEETYYPNKISTSTNLQYKTYKKNGMSITKYSDLPEMYTTAHFSYETYFTALTNSLTSYDNNYDKDELRFVDGTNIKIITTLIQDKTVVSQHGTKYVAFNQEFLESQFNIGSNVDTSDIFRGNVNYGYNSDKQIVIKQSYSEIIEFVVSELEEPIECALFCSNLYLLVNSDDGHYIRNVRRNYRYCLKDSDGQYNNTDESMFKNIDESYGYYFGFLGNYDKSKIPEIKEEDFSLNMGLL